VAIRDIATYRRAKLFQSIRAGRKRRLRPGAGSVGQRIIRLSREFSMSLGDWGLLTLPLLDI
jgi:hypothetical protein